MCKLENPLFALNIDRPTDVCITLSQTDDGLVTQPAIEAAIYIVKTPKHLPNRSILVKELNVKNVEVYSGDPIDEVEITVFAQLTPGAYTILCAPYKAGEEAPFTLHIRSNFDVRTNQIAPEWKRRALTA